MAYTDYLDTVQKVYIGYYQRAADPGGLIYWAARLDAVAGNLNEIIEAFANSAESQALYGTIDSTNIGDVVDGIYNALFGRSAEAAGKAYYVNGFNAGTFTAATIMLNVLDGAQGLDLLSVNNKLTAANRFTETIDPSLDGRDYQATYSGDADAIQGRVFLSTVGWNPITIPTQTETNAFIQDYIADPGDPILELPSGQTITLTTGIDIRTGTAYNDTFDGSVNAQGIATLTSVDHLDGAGGNDLLLGGLAGGNIAPTLRNIETAEFITAAATTFDLINTTGLNSLLMRNSSATLTVNNIASHTATAFTLQDQASNVNLNFTNGALTGVNDFTLNLSGAQATGGGATIAIAQQAGTDTSGLETVTLNSGGSTTNFLNSLTVQNAAGTSTISTLNVAGAQGLTVATGFATSLRTVDASGMTGSNGLTASFGATAAVTVTGSGGIDVLTFTANNANSSIDAGAGNDVISITNFDANDSIKGGDGTADRLDISAANAEGIAAALTNTTGFEQLSLNTAGSAGVTLNATRFGSIDTVRLDKGTAGAYTVTLLAGTQTLTIAEPTAATNATLGGALTVNDTGTATDDVLNLTNRDTDTTSATNNFAAAAITINGFETVNLNTGSAATAAQTIGVVTLSNDSLSGASTLNISGANGVTVNRVDSNSSGLLTINASGMTGTAALTMSNAPLYTVAAGTASITGSANADTLYGIAAASGSTIAGGAGNDTIYGGSRADNISGDAGNDSIVGGGGNDTITGGDGNDTIDVTGGAGTVSVDGGAGNDTIILGTTLTIGDVVVGGDGTDTMRISAAATAATAAGVSGFETLSLDDAIAQGMEQFTNNPGFTQINYNATANITVTNAAAAVATIQVTSSGGGNTYSFDRLVDTTSDSLTIKPLTGGARTVATLTIDDEESVTINTGTTAGDTLTVTTLNAADLLSLTVTGANNVAITNAIVGAANLNTISAAGLTGTLLVDASASTANGTFTGSFSAANTITGGTGADTITGGTAADSLTGGNGDDVIDGGAGADILLGGLGNDSITGGIGDDVIRGGAGNDTLVGGDGADDFIFESSSNGVDRITGFVSGTDDLDMVTGGVLGAIVAGQTITAAGAQQALVDTLAVDNSVHYISMNGAAANLTTGGTATLSTSDMTASTLTNLALYLTERFGGAGATTAGNDSVLVINWTAGGSTTSYVYEFVNADTGVIVNAAELTLIGIVDRGTTVLAVGDVI